MVNVPLHEAVDLLIAAANIGLAAVVIPTVLHGWRRKVCSIPLKTSLGRVFFLSVMGAAFALDQLWFSTGCIVGNISVWATLAAQNKLYAHHTVNTKERE